MGRSLGHWRPHLPALLHRVAVVALLSIRAARGQRTGSAEPVLAIRTRPHDVAYLNRGAELPGVRARGAAAARRDLVERATRRPSRAPIPGRRVERAVQPRSRRRRTASGSRTPPAARASGTSSGGLMRGRRSPTRSAAVSAAGVRAAGWAWRRLLAGIANAKLVRLLVVALLVVTIVAVVRRSLGPRRTRRGDRTLAALRDENHALSPSSGPTGRCTAVGAALGIRLFAI